MFFTADCQVLKLKLFDLRWPNDLQIHDLMKQIKDIKVKVVIDGSEIEFILLKHGPQVR